MKKTLATLVSGFVLTLGCSTNEPKKIDYGENKELRFPLESEFRPGPIPYHEMMHEEEYKEEKPLGKEYIDKHPSLWKRKLKGNFT